MRENIVDDAWDGARRLDINANGKTFPGMTVAEYRCPLIRPPIYSSVQRLNIDVEHENLVEYVQGFVELREPPTERAKGYEPKRT